MDPLAKYNLVIDEYCRMDVELDMKIRNLHKAFVLNLSFIDAAIVYQTGVVLAPRSWWKDMSA